MAKYSLSKKQVSKLLGDYTRLVVLYLQLSRDMREIIMPGSLLELEFIYKYKKNHPIFTAPNLLKEYKERYSTLNKKLRKYSNFDAIKETDQRIKYNLKSLEEIVNRK